MDVERSESESKRPSRKRSRDIAGVDIVPLNLNEFQFKQPSKRLRKTEYCYVVQMRQNKQGNNNQYRWDVIDSFNNLCAANQCVVQMLRNIFKVKSEYEINGAKFRKVVDENSKLIRFHDIIPPNSNGISIDIYTERHEIETIVCHER